MEGQRNNNSVRVNEVNLLSGSRFGSLLNNNIKEVETTDIDSYAGKGNSKNGISENMVGAIIMWDDNGNHDAIIKGVFPLFLL